MLWGMLQLTSAMTPVNLVSVIKRDKQLCKVIVG